MRSSVGLERKFEMSNGRVRHENPWIKVIDYDTKTDGRNGIYTVVERKDAAVVVLEHPKYGILLVNSYRYPICATSWELPMGGVEEGETPITAAFRELQEEIGLESVDMRQIGTFLPIPGLTPQRAYVFYGELSNHGVEQILQCRHVEDEIIGWKFVARDELEVMVAKQDIQDGITLGSLAIFLN